MNIRNKLGQFAKNRLIRDIKLDLLEIGLLMGLVAIFASLMLAVMQYRGMLW